MTNEEAPAQSRAATVANLLLLAISVVAVSAGLLIYVDRDGEGRTEDALVAADYIQVSPAVAGELVDLLVVENQGVAKGDLLFRLDERPYAAQLATAKGRHQSALALQRDKQLHYQRVKAEFDDGRIASRQAMDDAEAATQQAEAQVATTAGEVAAAQVDLDYCTVRARFDGIVAGLSTRPGEYVIPGQALFALIDADSYHVVAYMKEQYLGPAVPGAKAEVTLWQYPDTTFTGSVESVGRGVHGRTTANGLPVVKKSLDWVQLAARIPVRIRLETDRPLTMGATAHVRIVR